jgi:hypothetical protein
MSHTPGPWETQYRGNGESEVLANGADRDDVACICYVAGGLGMSIEEIIESEANAKLIAAAPELLDALKQAVRALNEIARFTVGYSDSYAIAMQCDHAIAKAEGRDLE